MKAFSERNPVMLAVAGTAVLAVVALGTFYSDDLPVIGGGTSYAADFTDAAGLKTGDDVTVAGVKVGTIRSITLDGDHVRVDFRVRDTWIGNTSTAAVKIKTLLGQEYVAIDPAGDARLDPGGVIPAGRTTTPLDVSSALSRLSTTVGAIDTRQLAQSFQTLSAAFADTPATIRSTLDGLTALSRTISDKDAELQQLAQRANDVTGVVSDSNKQFTELIDAGGALLTELQQRSAAITQLLDGTTRFAAQLSGLVHDDDAVLGPALRQLSHVTSILTSDNADLAEALRLIGPYYSMLNDTMGSGRWIDVYLCGLFDRTGTPVLDANAQRDCTPPAGGGR
jgi:phospholipid/cholesterol/gamma-HCH transport system substrate-binding protein